MQKVRQTLARLLIASGVLGLSLVGVTYLHTEIGSRIAVAAFKQAVAAESQRVREINLADYSPDQSLWSDNARAKYEQAKNESGAPLALLKIGRLDLEAPIFGSTDRVTLNRGIGIVEGTAMPGEVGNVVMSAHRDSFFRPLKDIMIGDVIELHTLDAVQNFQVTDLSITDPLDLSVLEPTEKTVLTLITCYPFYYIGFAPDRFIVRATPVTDTAESSNRISNQETTFVSTGGNHVGVTHTDPSLDR